MTGLGLFRSQARDVVPLPSTDPERSTADQPLRLADLNEAFVSVPAGLAAYVPASAPNALDPEVRLRELLAAPHDEGNGTTLIERLAASLAAPIDASEAMPVRTGSFLLMRHELTRGQWAQFLEEAESSITRLERTPWIRALWLPRTAEERAASDRYVGGWVRALRETLDTTDVERAWEELGRPLTARGRLLLLAPPSWIVVGDDDRLVWRMPAGTANFPVSEISAIDAEIFVVWARPAVRMSGLRLPTVAEFRRAFHNGNPPTLDGRPGAWPWGDAWRPLSFNNRRYQSHTGQAGPVGVLDPCRGPRRAAPHKFCGLAGNVAEWVHPMRVRAADHRATKADRHARRAAQAAGGSYRDAPDACRTLVWPAYPREARLPHVGFRLALSESSLLGGPR